MTLEGRVALVTGAARRVGRAIALELARGGCDIVLHHHRSQTEARDAALTIEALGRRCLSVSQDLSVVEDLGTMVSTILGQVDRLDILINNAAVFTTPGTDSLDAFSPRTWRSTLDVNLLAPAALCAAVAPVMRRLGGGRIVNLCDVAGERPWPGHLAYCVSKAGLACLTRALARRLAPTIQVNGVAPGIAVFPEDYSEETKARLIRKVPARRAGTAEEIARTVRFLVEGPAYITGQIVAVDGGRSVAG